MRKAPGLSLCAGLWLAVAGTVPMGAGAQAAPPDPASAATASSRGGEPDAPKPHIEQRIEPRELSGDFPQRPSMAPAWTIATESLGFAQPGALYLGARNSMASLDFIGENRLLFTFHVPALLRRIPGDQDASDEREIRAVVLAVPSGAVEAEANWLLHDRARYLWMLRDGHFLLRDRDSLEEGDASLKLSPLLKFPGPLLSVELDPSQRIMVTGSREPVNDAKAQGASDPSQATGVDTSDTSGANEPDIVLRILNRDSNQTILVTRVRDLVHVPANDEGYLDSPRGNGVDWTVDMNFFGGGSRPIGSLKSTCMPDLSFLSEHELLAAACADLGENALVAMSTSGRKLWVDVVTDREVWPLLVRSAGGERVGRETLYVTHSITAFAPLGDDEIKGQWLQVFDAATGRVAFETPVSPILDAGGNVAISPSGRRVAVLNGGAIEIFELPAPPAVPDAEHLAR